MSFLKKLFGIKDHYTKTLIRRKKTASKLLFKNINIFNGRDQELLKNKDVIIENGLIKTITENFDAPQNYKIINGKGKTLMPGLVDAHVHISGSGAVPWKNIKANEAYNLAAYLYTGITTVYDLGGIASKLSKLRKKVESGEILGPSFYHTHIPMTVRDSHPVQLTKEMFGFPLSALINFIAPFIGDPKDAHKAIQKYVKNGVDYVKLTADQIPEGSPEMSYEQIKAATDAAHKLGKKVFIHIGSPKNAVDAAKAGVDVIAHGVWRGKLTPQQADEIAACKVPIIYTLAGFQNVNQINNGAFQPTVTDRFFIPDAILDPVTGKTGLDVKKQPVMSAFFDSVTRNAEHWRGNLQLLRERGVNIIVGTDSSLPGTYTGCTFCQEIEALSNFGMSNFELLTGATYLSSRLFLDNPDFGLIEEGKKANLLILDDNPLEKLETIKNPAMIMLKGNEIERVANIA